MPSHAHSAPRTAASAPGAADDERIAEDSFTNVVARLAAPDTAVLLLTAARSGMPRTTIAYSAAGQRLGLEWQLRHAIATWITQHFPRLDPHRAYAFHLATGRLSTVADDAAVRA